MKGILGRKLGMTQVFTEDGNVVPVTVIEVSNNVVLQKKDLANDGYEAVQIGFADKKHPNKPAVGHAAKANATPKRYVRELRGVDDVVGVSKGKGFAGAIKRHNQSRGPMAHGSRYHRGPGSLGSINPGRVFKGQTLPGRMGGERTTVQNLVIVKVDTERNLLLVKGSVPGPKKSFVTVKSAVKAGK